MVKLMTRVTGHYVMLLKEGMHLIENECNPEYDLWEALFFKKRTFSWLGSHLHGYNGHNGKWDSYNDVGDNYDNEEDNPLTLLSPLLSLFLPIIPAPV